MEEGSSRDATDGGAQLRDLYPEPSELARKKCLSRLDRHCRKFISLSPFLCIGTSRPDGGDVSPRGDAPGFVRVLDDTTILIPDRPGNNLLDSLSNVTENPNVGILFMIPGIEETLRINGVASVVTDDDALASMEVNGKRPRSALKVEVREAFLHCAKAIRRSRLWDDDYRVDRGTFPTLGRMLTHQMETDLTPDEAEERVQDSLRNRLY
jgi:hypothetical protein